MKSFRSALLLSLAFALCRPFPLQAEWLKDQAVTYTNFDFVYSVTSSISRVYFATSGGIIRYNKIEQRWEKPLTGADGTREEVAKQVWVDKFDDRLYAKTDFGYYEYDLLFGRWLPINDLPDIDSYNRHVSAPDVLLPTFDANYMGEGRFVDIHGRSSFATDVVDDQSGNLWIGTWGFGPAKAGVSSGLMELLPYGLLQNRVNAMLPDDSVLWVSGAVFNDSRTGLTGFDHENNRFINIESGIGNSFPAEDVNCLEADDEQLYVGTPRGVYLLRRETRMVDGPINYRRGLLDDNVLSLCLLGRSLFVGTATGLSMFDLANDSIYHVRPKTFLNQIIYDLEPVNGTIWIASSAGAFRYTLETGRLQQYQDPDLILFGDVYDIEQSQDDLWFASDDGVVKLNTNTAKSESYRNISRRVDSRALAVNDMIAAVASDKGMTLIFHDRDKPHSREFTTGDGLPSNTVYCLLLDGDYIWVGSDRGLTHFLWNNPDRVD